MQRDEDEEDPDERHDDPDSDMEMDYRPPLEDSRYFSSSDSWCLFLCHYSVSSDCVLCLVNFVL